MLASVWVGPATTQWAALSVGVPLDTMWTRRDHGVWTWTSVTMTSCVSLAVRTWWEAIAVIVRSASLYTFTGTSV